MRRVSGVQVVHPLAHVNMVEGKIFKCEKDILLLSLH